VGRGVSADDKDKDGDMSDPERDEEGGAGPGAASDGSSESDSDREEEVYDFIGVPANPGAGPGAQAFSTLFRCLRPAQVVTVLEALLMEKRVLVFSNQLSVLAVVFECFRCLLYPFDYSHPYIPLLPHNNLSHPEAPMPYFIGVHACYETQLQHSGVINESSVIVYLDLGYVDVRSKLEGFPSFWKRSLMVKMRQLYESDLSLADHPYPYPHPYAMPLATVSSLGLGLARNAVNALAATSSSVGTPLRAPPSPGVMDPLRSSALHRSSSSSLSLSSVGINMPATHTPPLSGDLSDASPRIPPERKTPMLDGDRDLPRHQSSGTTAGGSGSGSASGAAAAHDVGLLSPDVELRRFMLHMWVEILCGYRSFFIFMPDETDRDHGFVFDVNGFLDTKEKAYGDFLKALFRTQLFFNFLTERTCWEGIRPVAPLRPPCVEFLLQRYRPWFDARQAHRNSHTKSSTTSAGSVGSIESKSSLAQLDMWLEKSAGKKMKPLTSVFDLVEQACRSVGNWAFHELLPDADVAGTSGMRQVELLSALDSRRTADAASADAHRRSDNPFVFNPHKDSLRLSAPAALRMNVVFSEFFAGTSEYSVSVSAASAGSGPTEQVVADVAPPFPSALTDTSVFQRRMEMTYSNVLQMFKSMGHAIPSSSPEQSHHEPPPTPLRKSASSTAADNPSLQSQPTSNAARVPFSVSVTGTADKR